jgi:hypothetical protein
MKLPRNKIVSGRRKEKHGEEIEKEHGKLKGDGEALLLAHLPVV